MRYVLVLLVCVSSLVARPRLVISVAPGQNYTHSLFFKEMPPQMAYWIEDSTGGYVETIYVSPFTWEALQKGSVKRPEALPVWLGRYRAAHADQPDGVSGATEKKGAEPDGVSGATPHEQFSHEWDVPASLPQGRYRVLAELNNSFDYNDTYAKNLKKGDPNYNGVNGQPSVVWIATVTIHEQPDTVTMRIAGHGDHTGHSARLFPHVDGVTSASQMVRQMLVTFHP
jgi:hypothetical protein